jgi:hypothetical protein
MRVPQAEGRRHPRQEYQGEVYLEEDEGEELKAFNLSRSGVGLHSPRRLGTGRQVELSFLGRNMSVVGVVRRESELTVPLWQIGVEFTQPQPELEEVALTIPTMTGGTP